MTEEDTEYSFNGSSVVTLPEREKQLQVRVQDLASIYAMLDLLPSYISSFVSYKDHVLLPSMLLQMFIQIDTIYQYNLSFVSRTDTEIRDTETSGSTDATLYWSVWNGIWLLQKEIERIKGVNGVLVDTVKSCLATLDDTRNMTGFLYPVYTNDAVESAIPDLSSIDSQSIWDSVLASTCEVLLQWQQTYASLPSFSQQFEGSEFSSSQLRLIDTSFSGLLDSAGAIFGDILPGFRLLTDADSEAIATLLFDLLQQGTHIGYHISHIQNMLPSLQKKYFYKNIPTGEKEV